MDSLNQLLLERRQSPGVRRDAAHIALCIEGGGLRGAVTGGMACAIEELGLLPCFDSVFASSVGSLTAAYLVSGQARKHRDFFTYMAGREDFVDLSVSAFASGRVLNMTLLAEQFSDSGPFPLRTEKLTSAPLHPLLTRAGWHRAGSAGHIRDLSDPDQWPLAISDSMRIPGLCGWPHGQLRRAAWDAAPHEAIPFRTPLQAGASHLLVLRSAAGRTDAGLSTLADFAFRRIAGLNRWLLGGVGMRSYQDQSDLVAQAPPGRVGQVFAPASCSPLTASPDQVGEADRRGEQALLDWWEGLLRA